MKPRPTTHCIHGHALTGDNLYVRANGSRYCKACRDEYELDRRDLRASSGARVKAKVHEKTHCARGHELTPDNIVPDRDGSRRCKTCKNLARASMTEKQRATIAENRKKYNQRNYVGVKSFAAPVTLGSRPSDEVIAEAQRRAAAVPRDLTGMLLGDPPVGFSMLDRRQSA